MNHTRINRTVHHVSSHFHTEDGLKLHIESWLPVQQSKAAVIMLHGAAEHIGRYAHVAAHFAAQGYAVHGYDQRGHGKSEGKRGYFNTFQEPINDFAHYLAFVRGVHAERPIFIFAHSMGALVILAYAITPQATAVNGIMTIGVPLAIDEGMPNLMVSAARALNQFAPETPLVTMDVTGMSRDPAVLATWTADPYNNLTLIRLRTSLGIIGTARHVRVNLADLTAPLLILHGGADRITDPLGSEVLFAGAASADKTLKIYPDLYHELVNEPERIMVLNDMVRWLDHHLPVDGKG